MPRKRRFELGRGLAVDDDKGPGNLLSVLLGKIGAEKGLEVLDDGDHPLPAALILDDLVGVGKRSARVDAADARKKRILPWMNQDLGSLHRILEL